MRVCWLYPTTARCGISFYSRAYTEALGDVVDIIPRDIMSHDYAALADEANSCDCVHLQYETAFFPGRFGDSYRRLCRALRRPLIVTLHEVYERFPDAYPRAALRGGRLTLPLRRLLYDIRHPYQTAARAHERASYHARALVVHHRYQKDILRRRGVGPDIIRRIPYPVRWRDMPAPSYDTRPVSIVGLGFVSNHVNYPLLFETLERLTIEWRFTWIGGPRRSEDRALLARLQSEITRRSWSDRFIVTGWVSDAQRDALLADAHACLALARAKSSSESLATAMGCGRPIVCTDLALFRELEKEHAGIVLCQPSGEDIARQIERLILDTPYRDAHLGRMHDYASRTHPRAIARQCADLYREAIEE